MLHGVRSGKEIKMGGGSAEFSMIQARRLLHGGIIDMRHSLETSQTIALVAAPGHV